MIAKRTMKRLLLVVAACACTAAQAQADPNRPIKFVVPFPPGGNLDFVARSLQPKMQEVLGQPVLIDNKGGAAGMIGLAGTLKALAVTGKARLASLPDVPTFEQAGLAGVDASGFQGVLAPAGTPPEAVAKLSDALNKALAQPEVQERFSAAGLDVASSSPAEFAAFIRSEIAKWGRVAKEANIKLD